MSSIFDASGAPRSVLNSGETSAPPPSAHDIVGEETSGHDRIEGHIDLIDGERVVGWAYDAGAPGRRLLIEVSAGDTVEVVLANIARNDLSDAGKGDGRHGFEAMLDIASTGADTVHVRVVATGRDLAGSPASTDFADLVVRADDGQGLEYLKSEAQLALLSLKGVKKR